MNKTTKYGGLLLIIVLIVSIYYNLKLSDSQKNTPKTQEISFERKQECAIYKKQIEDKFERNNNGEIAIEYYYFDKIFYSPKQESCLYVYSGSFGIKAKDRYTTLYLADALSGDVITQATVISEGKFMADAQSNFNQLVKSYEPQ